MSFLYNIQVQVDDTVHEVGGFDTARAAAGMARVEASKFGSLRQSSDETEAAIEAGEKSISIGYDRPITVLVS